MGGYNLCRCLQTQRNAEILVLNCDTGPHCSRRHTTKRSMQVDLPLTEELNKMEHLSHPGSDCVCRHRRLESRGVEN